MTTRHLHLSKPSIKRSIYSNNFRLRVLLIFLLPALLIVNSNGQWLEGYCHRKAITINASQVDGSDHTDFPVMILIENDSDIRSVSNTGLVVSDDGNDFRFTDNGGLNLLDFEIEDYNEVSGDLVAWVRIPTLSSSVNTVIYLYFGNPTATAYSNPEGTWNSSYLGVWHTNTDANDATTNGNDGDPWGTTDAAGIAGRARAFNGADSIILPNIHASEGTFSFWMNLDNDFDNTTAISQTLVGKYQDNDNYFSIYLCGLDHSLATENGHIKFEIGNSVEFPKQISTTSSWTAGNWYMISGRWGTNDHSLLVNGVEEDSESVTQSLENWGQIELGSGHIVHNGVYGGVFYGIMDEVRLSNVNRSDAWLSTEYANLSNPLSFRTIGSLEGNMPTADAGAAAELCGVQSHALFATPSIGTGTWSYVSGPDSSPVFYDINSPTSSVSVIFYGTYVFRWTEINGSCTDNDEVTIVFNEHPIATAGADKEMCDMLWTNLEGVQHAYQPGSEHTGSTGYWSYVSGPDISPAFTDPNSPMSDVTVTFFGTYVFRWTETNGSCTDSDDVIIDFNERPMATTGADQELCDVLTTTLDAMPYPYQVNSEHNGSEGQWSCVFGPDLSPVFADINSPMSDVTVALYGSYVFRWTETNGSCTDSDEVTIDFNEHPMATAGVNQELCDILTTTFDAIPFAYQAGSEHAGSTAIWSWVSGPDFSPAFTDPNSPTSDVTVTLPGSYVFRWTETNGLCTEGDDVTIIFHEKPIGLSSPETQMACSEMEITPIHFANSNGNDAATTYEWTRDNIANVFNLDLSGTGDVSGTPLNFTGDPQIVNYTVTPTSFGSCTGDPFNVEVIVNPVPEVDGSQPSQIICSEMAIYIDLFTWNGMDAVTTFSWTRDNTGFVMGIANSGTGDIFDVLTNYTPVTQPVNYTIIPTSDAGCVGNEFNAEVIVLPEPMGISTPYSQTVCSDEPITDIILSTIDGMDAGTSYEWTRDNTVNVTGLSNNGTGNISGTPVNHTGVVQSVDYTIIPTSADHCLGDPYRATVEVLPMPIGIASPVSQTACSDQPISDILLSTSNGLDAFTTYTWIRDNMVNVTGLANSGTGDISGVPINYTGVRQIVTFTITPTSSDGCQGDPYTAYIEVYPQPTGTANPAAQTVCPEEFLTEIQLSTINGMDVGTTYVWTRDNMVNVTGLENSGTGNIVGMPINNTGIIQLLTYTITPISASGCNGDPFIASVIVNPKPMGVATPVAQIVCSDDAITDIVLNTSNGMDVGTTYAWTRDNTVNVIGLENSGAGNINGTPINLTGVTQVITYTITPTSADLCIGDPFTATVIVNPRPIGTTNPLTQTVCSDAAITDIVLSTINGMNANTSYAWTRDNTTNVLGLASSGTGNISGTPANLTYSIQDVTYTITPTSSDGCIGDPFTAVVSVNPIPEISLSASDTTLCNGETTTLSVANRNITSSGTWVYDIDVTVDPHITGATIDQVGVTTLSYSETLTNTDSVAHPVIYHFTPRIIPDGGGTDCGNGRDTTIVIWVNPTPGIRVNLVDTVICNEDFINLFIQNPNISTLGEWRYNLTVDYGTYITGNNIGGDYSFADLVHTDQLINHDSLYHYVDYHFTPRISPDDFGPDCSNGIDTTIRVWVNPTPAIRVHAEDTILCNGEPASILVSNPNTFLNGEWEYDLVVNSDPEITGARPSVSGSTDQLLIDPLTNHDTAVHKVEYTFIPRKTPDPDICASGNDTTIVIWVNPVPEARVTANNMVLCDGDDVSLELRNPNTEIRGMWDGTLEIIVDQGITGIMPGITAFNGDAIYNFTLNNSEVVPRSVTFRFIPQIRDNNGDLCTNGIETVVVIWVNPIAQVNDPADQEVIHNESSTAIVFTSNNTGGEVTYSWINDTPSVGLANSGLGNIPSFISVNTGISTVLATITVSPDFTNAGLTCQGPDEEFTITVYPVTPDANAGPDQEICGTLAANLEGNDPLGGVGTWTQVSGIGTIAFGDVNNYSTTATATLYGTYVLRWTITSSGAPSMDDVTISFVEDPLQASAGVEQEVCGTLTTTLAGVSHAYQSGSEHPGSTKHWSYVSGPDPSPVFGDETSSTSIVTVNSFGSYVLCWTETNGTCSHSDEVTIDFYNNPTADAGPDQEICSGEPVTLNASGGTQYSWDPQLTNGVPFIPHSTDDYIVTVTDANGCSDQDTVVVVVKPIPQTPVITFITGTLNSDSDLGNQWYLDETLIPDAEDSYYVPNISGTYYSIVTENGCVSEKSNDIFVQITDISPYEERSLKIYPNPTVDFIQIETENIGQYILEISASTGQLISQQLVSDPIYTLNLESYINGLYFITIRTEDYVATRKIVKL